MLQRKVDVGTGCPGAAVIIICHAEGAHQPSLCAGYRAWMLRCKNLRLSRSTLNGLLCCSRAHAPGETPGLSWWSVIWNSVQPGCNVHFRRSGVAVNEALCCQSKWRNRKWVVAAPFTPAFALLDLHSWWWHVTITQLVFLHCTWFWFLQSLPKRASMLA